MKPLGFALLAALSLALPSVAEATRCGNHVVSRGQTPLEVKRICGAPVHVEQSVESRTIRRFVPRIGYVEQRVTVPIERWTFAPAKNRLLRSMVFENGRLARIISEGRTPKGEPTLQQCQRSIHSNGDTTAEVRLRCGPPADVHRWYEERAVGQRILDTIVEQRVLVTHERWIYNFGPRRFLRILTFEDGRLVDQKTGDYGF